MEDGLVLDLNSFFSNDLLSLNPCCSGRWSRTSWLGEDVKSRPWCLNPCYGGRWSRISIVVYNCYSSVRVLILVVVEDGLVPSSYRSQCRWLVVLILVVVEDGLVLR